MEHGPWKAESCAGIKRQPEKVCRFVQKLFFFFFNYFLLYAMFTLCCRLELDYVDLYLMHSAMGGRTVETWDAMIELKEKGLIKYTQ